MSALVYGILIFIISFLIHLIVWKTHLPKKKHIIILLGIFGGVLAISVFILKSSSSIVFYGVTPPQSFLDYIELSLLYISLTLAYTATYSAVEVDSPSLTIVLSIAKAAPAGLNKEKLYNEMTDEVLMKPRIRDLVTDGLVCKDKDKYRITSAGIFLADVIILWRKLLNAPKGG